MKNHPVMLLCDAHDCQSNDGEGACKRTEIGINSFGTCDHWQPKPED